MSFVDDVIVKKLYACPVCFETFAKWGTCLIHLNSNASCHSAIGEETFRIQEELQDLCRKAANGEFPLMKHPQYHELPVPVTNFDPNAMSFDPNAVSFDPNAMSFDPKAATFYPKAAGFDPQAAGFDPQAVSFDPKAVSFDPTATMFDPKVGYDFLPTVPEVVSPPKPSPVGLSLTSLVAAPVPMPVGPVRHQVDDKGGYQWQASSEKLLDRFEKTVSGSTEKITIDDWMPSKLDEHVKLRLHYAVSTGFLLKEEQNALQKTLNSLVSYVPEEQRLVIQKFLSPSFDDFRAIVNKLFWLQRCMEYCRSSSTRTERIEAGSAQEKLLMALDLHGLREAALTDECWTTFEMFPPPLQEMVVQAVKASLPMKTEKKQLSQHFAHLAVNEESIYNLQTSRPDDEVVPTQASWEAFSDSQYHELLRQLLVNSRNAEDRVLQLLSEEASGPKATPSLLHVHVATEEARRGRSAEVISLLHAAAACGLSRLCARFIAEGLDVNERTGHQHFSPLHLAASNGNVRATETLLENRAFPWLLDDCGKTPLYHVVTSLPESSEAEQQLLLQICQQLVFGMLQASDEDELLLVESALEILQQSELSWLLQLQYRMRELQLKNPAIYTPEILVELGRMHYETLNLLLSFFDGDRCKLNVPDDALLLEFAAALKSDFIQVRFQSIDAKLSNALRKVIDYAGDKSMQVKYDMSMKNQMYGKSGDFIKGRELFAMILISFKSPDHTEVLHNAHHLYMFSYYGDDQLEAFYNKWLDIIYNMKHDDRPSANSLRDTLFRKIEHSKLMHFDISRYRTFDEGHHEKTYEFLIGMIKGYIARGKQERLLKDRERAVKISMSSNKTTPALEDDVKAAAPTKTKKEDAAAASSAGDPPKGKPKAKAKSEAASVLPTPSPKSHADKNKKGKGKG
ncbi:unnamed protein product [Cladocopium goreaui]|uniref:Ankyrin repeat, PH and SEC7 domain containing protein secG n=1 Tax=Cladocopium goreaui TaxID=2562237 RepID=A0A9P1CF98_9DINO|nr:unnamed protein product [Cladocopium goreaui]